MILRKRRGGKCEGRRKRDKKIRGYFLNGKDKKKKPRLCGAFGEGGRGEVVLGGIGIVEGKKMLTFFFEVVNGGRIRREVGSIGVQG